MTYLHESGSDVSVCTFFAISLTYGNIRHVYRYYIVSDLRISKCDHRITVVKNEGLSFKPESDASVCIFVQIRALIWFAVIFVRNIWEIRRQVNSKLIERTEDGINEEMIFVIFFVVVSVYPVLELATKLYSYMINRLLSINGVRVHVARRLLLLIPFGSRIEGRVHLQMSSRVPGVHHLCSVVYRCSVIIKL